ncbi:hypothetical protein Varpa_2737 [Variovorax paradoxus EPS]|uniref:Uncharacterized protein n=1 Tax=Variovorax paradoxus (strain EPS) TaxID=595537 RepID=E6V3R1_VARPE|nr:hypothetical protein Varpa_2737 [Variovorax paradoxus EPS]
MPRKIPAGKQDSPPSEATDAELPADQPPQGAHRHRELRGVGTVGVGEAIGRRSVLPIATSTIAARSVVEDVYKLLREAAQRDEAGVALAERFRVNGALLDRFVREAETYSSKQLLLGHEEGERARRCRAVALRRWGGSLFSLLLPWISGDGPDRAKASAVARRESEQRNTDIAAAASKLLQLMDRNAGAALSEMQRGAPHLPVDVFLPRLRQDLNCLIDAASGRRRERRAERALKSRAKDGLPELPTRGVLPYGAEGFVTEVDRTLPFVASSNAIIDLWQFVSGQVIGESAVRAARKRRAMRTS